MSPALVVQSQTHKISSLSRNSYYIVSTHPQYFNMSSKTWYCCECKDGPKGTKIEVRCLGKNGHCNHEKCRLCPTEAPKNNHSHEHHGESGGYHAYMYTSATVLEGQHHGHDYSNQTPVSTFGFTPTRGYRSDHSPYGGTPTDGSVSYYWYCCHCSAGPNNKDLHGACSYCNNHIQCGSCKVEKVIRK